MDASIPSLTFEGSNSERTEWEKIQRPEYEADQNVIDTQDISHPVWYLTRKTGSATLFSNNIRYHITMPEYPESSQEGVLHVIHITGQTRAKIESLHSDIQFGRRGGNHRTVKCDFLNNDLIEIYQSTCSGVKMCPHVHPVLRDFSNYTAVDDTWYTILEATRRQPIVDPNLPNDNTGIFRATQGLYLALSKYYFETRPCTPYGRCPGRPRLRSSFNLVTGVPEYHIGCSKYRDSDGIRHSWNRLKDTHVFDPTYLQTLFQTMRIQSHIRNCSTIECLKATRRKCPEIHLTPDTTLVKYPCHVAYSFVIPQDTVKHPWVFLFSKGLHPHPPPPPTRTPQAIFDKVHALMTQHNLLTLTRGEFLRSPQMASFLRDHHADFISNIHPSLNNDDLWRFHIQAARLLEYPQGTDFVGVVHEAELQKRNHNVYIQEIIDDDDGDQLICCFTYQQAKDFMGLKFFQVDMTFKRIHNRITEIVFGYYNDDGQKSFTVARIYVNQDTQPIYEKAFSILFRNLARVTGRIIEFHHIHGAGIQCVIGDMCGKQASGLGHYLHSIDPSRTWRQHVSSIMIYCLIHYERNIRQFQVHPLYMDMKALPRLRSRAEVQLVFNRLRTDPIKKIRDFAGRYNCQMILGGLNQEYTTMRRDFFSAIQHHSNTLESIHRKTNQMGIHQSWLGALKSAQNIDSREMNSVATWYSTGVKHSWHDKSPSKRQHNALVSRDRHIRSLKAKSLSSNSQSVIPQIPDPQAKEREVIKLSSDSDLEGEENSRRSVYNQSPTRSTAKRGRPTSLVKAKENDALERSRSRRRLEGSTLVTGSQLNKEQWASNSQPSQDWSERQAEIDRLQQELDSEIQIETSSILDN